MNTPKVLFQLLLDNVDMIANECPGLCSLIHALCRKGYIDPEESNFLFDVIYDHAPRWYMLRYYVEDGMFQRRDWDNAKNYAFYWKKHSVAPRKRWLKKQIAKL
jgi:hypothetical protein